MEAEELKKLAEYKRREKMEDKLARWSYVLFLRLDNSLPQKKSICGDSSILMFLSIIWN